MRHWTYRIRAQEEGDPLGHVLRKAGFTKKEISRQKFLTNGILLDGEQSRTTANVHIGQELVLNFSEDGSGTPLPDEALLPLKVCYEDRDVLIVDKPSGLSCHTGKGHYRDNLGSLAAAYLREKGDNVAVRQIGRLDKDTSGLVVFARSQVAAARLWRQRENGCFHKTYQAVISGRIEQGEGILEFPMRKVVGAKNRMEVCADGMRAVTHYRVTGTGSIDGKKVTLVECTLETGRTHQIRVHMAYAGYPLVGDCLYGEKDSIYRLQLHAGRVRFCQPFTGEIIEVASQNEGIPFV